MSGKDRGTETGKQRSYRFVAPPRTPPKREHTRPAWSVGVVALLIVVAAALIGPTGAPAHQAWVAVARAVTRPLGDPNVPVIQSTIDLAAQAQARLISAGDAALLSDTSTARYYRELAETDQRLIAEGVRSITLDQLTWHSISVSGGTATAIATETWTTTYADGTTSESTETNVYTLVRQGEVWLIDRDQKSDSIAGGATSHRAWTW